MTLEEFHKFITDYLAITLALEPDRLALVEPTSDLIGSNIIDSFAFIDLCLAIEEETGIEIDMAELDIEQFTTINALHHLTAQVPVASTI